MNVKHRCNKSMSQASPLRSQQRPYFEPGVYGIRWQIPRKVGRQASPGDGEGLKRMAVIRADPGLFDAFRQNGEKQRSAKTRFAKTRFAKTRFAKTRFAKKTFAKKTFAKKTFAKKTFAKKRFFRPGFPIRGALRQMIANKGLAFAKASPRKNPTGQN